MIRKIERNKMLKKKRHDGIITHLHTYCYIPYIMWVYNDHKIIMTIYNSDYLEGGGGPPENAFFLLL